MATRVRVGECLLERRGVDPDEPDGRDALLRLDVVLKLLVPRDVGLECCQRAVGFGVPGGVGGCISTLYGLGEGERAVRLGVPGGGGRGVSCLE